MVAVITEDDVRQIAETKMPDLNAYDLEEAMNIIIGSARNMGIAVKGINEDELIKQAEAAAVAAKEQARREAELEKLETQAAEAAAEAEADETDEETDETVEEEEAEETESEE